MKIDPIFPGSPEFALAFQLRADVLLDPFGIDHGRAQSDDAQALHFGAFSDGSCLGCFMLVDQGAGIARMRQIAVRTDLWRTGVGRALMQHAEQVAKAEGFFKIVAHARASALPFYLALGYSALGERFEEVGLPHLMVEKSLR